MAAYTDRNPWIFDAVGQGVNAVQGAFKAATVRAVYGGADGQVILVDDNGNEVFVGAALSAGNATQTEYLDGNIYGIHVSQLPAGAKVYVYIE